MFLKLLDLFINKKAHHNEDLLFRLRFFVCLIFVFSFFNFITATLAYLNILQDSFNFQALFYVFIGTLILIKLNVSINLITFAFIFFSMCLNLAVVDVTGGIYSYNLKWLIIFILFAITFNYKAYNKSAFVYMFFSLAAIIYFYVIEGNVDRNDFNNMLMFEKNDYLIENILHLVVFSSILFFYYLSHNHLLFEIKKKNIVLEEKNLLNLSKTKQLKAIKEKLEDTNRELRSYAYATSHDLNEPLRTITSFTQLLKIELSQTALTEDAKEYLNYIELGGKRMFNLVEDALMLAKVDSIKTASFELIDLNVLLKEVLFDLSNQIEKTKSTIQFKNLPNIKGNQVEIKRLFQNLISNAMKFSRPNVIPVVAISASLKNKQQLFSIEDNGIGINTKKLKTIFEPYKRLNDKRDGTGLGLTICKKIVEMHKGKIWAEPKKEHGTVLKFTIPAV